MLDEYIIYTWLQTTRQSGCTAKKENKFKKYICIHTEPCTNYLTYFRSKYILDDTNT